jgi:thymidine kinase
MSNIQDSAYLEIFLGPMYSGKTTKLINLYNAYKLHRINVLCINHSSDTRYHESMMSTHDKIMIPCIQTDSLMRLCSDKDEIIDYYNVFEKCGVAGMKEEIDFSNIKVIMINEGQFFNDIYEFVVKMLKLGKIIYVCGLDGDFERKKFGYLLDLIPICDNVSKLKAVCKLCNDGTGTAPAIFSHRLTNEKEQTVIGSENYIPLCRKCYKLCKE